MGHSRRFVHQFTFANRHPRRVASSTASADQRVMRDSFTCARNIHGVAGSQILQAFTVLTIWMDW